VAARGDARYQGQRQGHGGQRQAPGRDLRRGPAVGGVGHQARRGTDDGGRVLGGPGQLRGAERAEYLAGREGPAARVEQRLRDHGHGGASGRGEAGGPGLGAGGGGGPGFGAVGGEDFGVGVGVTAEQGRQRRAASG
jgi:hypothetical protein